MIAGKQWVKSWGMYTVDEQVNRAHTGEKKRGLVGGISTTSVGLYLECRNVPPA